MTYLTKCISPISLASFHKVKIQYQECVYFQFICTNISQPEWNRISIGINVGKSLLLLKTHYFCSFQHLFLEIHPQRAHVTWRVTRLLKQPPTGKNKKNQII